MTKNEYWKIGKDFGIVSIPNEKIIGCSAQVKFYLRTTYDLEILFSEMPITQKVKEIITYILNDTIDSCNKKINKAKKSEVTDFKRVIKWCDKILKKLEVYYPTSNGQINTPIVDSYLGKVSIGFKKISSYFYKLEYCQQISIITNAILCYFNSEDLSSFKNIDKFQNHFNYFDDFLMKVMGDEQKQNNEQITVNDFYDLVDECRQFKKAS